MNDLNFSPASPGMHRASAQRYSPLAAARTAAAAALITCALTSAGIAVAEVLAANTSQKLVSDASEKEDRLAPVRALLARYDREHDDRALLEALRWFDRSWAAGDERAIALAQPLHARVCAHRLLQQSWLCDPGE